MRQILTVLMLLLASYDFSQSGELVYLWPDRGYGSGIRPGNTAAETWPLLAEKWIKKLLLTDK